MEVNPSNRVKVSARITQLKEKLADAERNLRKAMSAMSDSAAAREELFNYEGTNEDAVSERRCVRTY